VAVASAGLCKSAPHPGQPRQHPTTQFFTGRMPFLTPNQQRQSTEGIKAVIKSDPSHNQGKSPIDLILSLFTTILLKEGVLLPLCLSLKQSRLLLQPFYGYLDFVRNYPGKPIPQGKANLDLLEQEIVSGSGISWAICKSALRP